jgi:hypothetical protein
VAAIPFLWVLPLSLYLLSFILCFDSDRWYRRWLFTRLGAISLPAMAYAISTEASFSDLRLAVAFFCTTLFVLFMVCHGELARRRPSPRHLTAFYLMVSVGGAVGGLLIGFAAPYLTNALYDLPVVICLTAFLLLWLLWRERAPAENVEGVGKFLDAPYDKPVIGVLIAGLIGYLVYRLHAANHGGPKFLNADYDPWVLLGIAAAIALYVLWRGRGSVDEGMVLFTVAAGICIGMAGFLARDTYNSIGNSRLLVRNFYGALRVYDSDSDGTMGPVRTLRHGTIDHGEQFLLPENQRFAATYYAKQSGVGMAILNLQQQGPMNVGVIGLGSGTLTTYERAQDHYTVYDINPVVVKIAETQFTFLKNCLGPHEIVLGDARLSLEADPPKQFDLLAVDAFSGDAIPVHLLTREAFALYWRHMKPNGVLAVHVSNRFLSLGPVVNLAAAADNKRAMMFSNDEDDNTEVAASDWVLVTSRPGFFDEPGIKQVGKKIDPIGGLRLWTDDYSNLYKILR